MKQEEHILQKSFVRWFDYQYPNRQHQLFAVPNGGQRNKSVAAKLKYEGVRRGVSDLILIHNSKTYFIEVKTPKGTQSDNQKEFEQCVVKQGFLYIIIKTFEEFESFIVSILGR